MPVGSVAVKERHQPLVLVDTAGLSEEEWLALPPERYWRQRCCSSAGHFTVADGPGSVL